MGFPKTTKDDRGQTWVHPERPRYYLHRGIRDNGWVVIDRDMDYAVTKAYPTEKRAVAEFFRNQAKDRRRQAREAEKAELASARAKRAPRQRLIFSNFGQ